MNELDCHRALAYARSDPLHRAVSDVAHSEDARNAGLQQSWIAFEGPALRPLAGTKQIGAGQNEAPFVSFDDAIQPSRPGLGADEDEQRISGNATGLAADLAHTGNGFQTVLTVHLNYARAVLDMNIGGGPNLVDQVLGHSGA